MALSYNISECSSESTIYITNEKDAAEWLYSSADVIFASIVVPCMMTLGFLSNSAFIYTVYRIPELRTITNAYLVNMAIADLIYIELHGVLVFVLSYSMSPIKGDVHFGQIRCFIRSMISVTCYHTSFILVTCVAVERFLAICHPLYQQKVNGKSRTVKIIITSWLLVGIITSILNVPQVCYWKTSCIVWPRGEKYMTLPKKISTCTAFPRYPIVISQIADVVLYWVTLVINFIVYTRIITAMRRRASVDLGTRQSQNKNVHQVARLLITNGVVFFLCFTPWQFANLDRIATNLTGSHLFFSIDDGYVRIISYFMSYRNSLINPFVYKACSSTYRNAYVKAFCRNCNKWIWKIVISISLLVKTKSLQTVNCKNLHHMLCMFSFVALIHNLQGKN